MAFDNTDVQGSTTTSAISAGVTILSYVYAAISENNMTTIAWWLGSVAAFVAIVSGCMSIRHKWYETRSLRRQMKKDDN